MDAGVIKGHTYAPWENKCGKDVPLWKLKFPTTLFAKLRQSRVGPQTHMSPNSASWHPSMEVLSIICEDSSAHIHPSCKLHTGKVDSHSRACLYGTCCYSRTAKRSWPKGGGGRYGMPSYMIPRHKEFMENYIIRGKKSISFLIPHLASMCTWNVPSDKISGFRYHSQNSVCLLC